MNLHALVSLSACHDGGVFGATNLRMLYAGRVVRVEPYWRGRPKAQLRLRRDVVNA